MARTGRTMPQIDLLTFREGYASDWTATNPILSPGEPGFETDTGKMKVGNGATPWIDLPYMAGGEGGGSGGGGITTEDAVDATAQAFAAGTHTNVTVTYNDAANSISLAASGGTGGGITTEDAVDAVAASLIEGAGIDIAYDDTANTITLAATAAPVTAFPVSIGVALSDEVTSITTGAAKLTIRAPYAFTLTAVRASLSTPSLSGVVTVDINKTGVSVLSTLLTLDQNEKTSTTAAVPVVISDGAITDDAEITFDVDTAGLSAKGLKVWLIGTRSV